MSEPLQLTPEVVAFATKEVDIQQYYEPAEAATPKHLMYNDFIEKTKWKGLPKVLYYIIMDQAFFAQIAKAASGDLGYKLKLKQQ